ncbi:6863_t:CDS:10 [Paraglomus occultum]|uniref:6863_t:CDS:1 n=1 Tax=Paraglomus occultum TaxID=144539 RepID=A0A9N9BY02_9GLOM|nr:6863_t:CDS:10 [Paraglomus occultum]
MAFNQGNNNSTAKPTFGFAQNPGGFSFGSSTNAASPSFGGAMQNNNSILRFGSASQNTTSLTFGASQTTAATSPFATAITTSAGTSPFAAAQAPSTFSGFGGLGFGGLSQTASTRPSFGGINTSATSAPASTGLSFGFGGLSQQTSSAKPLFGGSANTATTSTSAPTGLSFGFGGQANSTKPLFGGTATTTSTSASPGFGFAFGALSQANSTKPSFGGFGSATAPTAPATAINSTRLSFGGFGSTTPATTATAPATTVTAPATTVTTPATTVTTNTSAPTGFGGFAGFSQAASTKSPLGGAVTAPNSTNSTGLGFGFGALSQTASTKPFNFFARSATSQSTTSSSGSLNIPQPKLSFPSKPATTTPVASSATTASTSTTAPLATTSTSATTSLLTKPPISATTSTTASGSTMTGLTAPTVPNWLKTASIEDIMNKWNKDLDVCEKAFHSQAKEIGEMDRKVIDNIGKVNDIANQVESIKSIQQVIRSDLDNIVGQAEHLEKIVEQYETKYANITAETAVDKTREKSYKLVESMNEELDKMGQTLATIITEVNRNMSTSNGAALSEEADDTTQNEEEDALDEVVKILNAHLTSLQWIDQTATKLSEQFKATKYALRDAQGNGNESAWSQIKDYRLKRTAALALVACIAFLYVSPTSSEASDLVKAHMGTLVAIDKERKRLLVTYPSEPVLSEAALEVLSEENSELEILRELDGAFQSGGIMEAGCQGELVARLLLLSAWRRLICCERKRTGQKVSFLIRRPVLDFLDELIANFPRENCSQLDGADLAIPVIRESNNGLGALIFQIKNYSSVKQNRFEETHAVKVLLSPEVMFADDCYADIEKNYLGIFVHLGSAYEDESGTAVSNYDNRKLFEECDSGNRLTIHGLNAFKLDDNHQSIFKNLLRAWNDPGRLCHTDIEKNCMYQLLPCVYPKKRSLDEGTAAETSKRTRTTRQSKRGSQK